MHNIFKSGDKVRYKDEPVSKDNEFTVYAVYDSEHVSLGLREYPDVEQDFQNHISEIEKI